MKNITKTDTFQQGIKSVQDPSAQSARKLQGGVPRDATISMFRSYIDANKDSRFYMEAITILMIDNGLRISEALSIRIEDVLPSFEIIIKGKKGSSNRIIPIRYNLKYWENILSNPDFQICHYSRWSFYRYFKKKGLYERIVGHKNNSVTHSARHAKVRMLQAEGVDRSTRANYIGHKNINSQEYYERKKK